MKYQRLTKEQFEELHKEFINFLASQSITAEEWKEIKKTKPHLAEQELDVFSDLIWEGVLARVKYLESISPYSMQLFYMGASNMHLIAVKLNDKSHDLTSTKGFKWFVQNLMDDSIELFTASKAFSEERHHDIFQLITQGAVISEGELYRSLDKFIKGS